MIEIRIHGWGGQGNVVAAYVLAAAAIGQGRFAQAFPALGQEECGIQVRKPGKAAACGLRNYRI